MSSRVLIACLLFASAGVVASSTQNVWLTALELERHCASYLCDPASEEGSICIAYMQGFLAGAERASETSSRWMAATAPSEESFLDRATRTRVGPGVLDRVRARTTTPSEYCIDPDVNVLVLVEKVAAHLNENLDGHETVDRLVHEALVQNFPCAD